jgi:M6 family metalloprotease-like protein
VIMNKKFIVSTGLLGVLTACTFSLPYDSVTGGEPLQPTALPLGHDVGDFWSIPATGNPKVLVVPIDFPDLPFSNPTQVVEQIHQAFNAETTDPFQSVNAYYQTSSYGLLDLEGVVVAPYQTQFTSAYYENLNDGGVDANTVIIDELMNAYNDTIDFSDFDLNDDGTLDGLYMIYNHPAEGWNSFWWAYLYAYFGNQRFDDVKVTSYVWMPYEMTMVNNQIDASTIIHETGHKLGLEDYYDYASDDGSNNEWGLGGADMMDSTVGDHNPFSKLLLGWIQPKIITESMDLILNPFTSSGDAYIITDDWNGSLFDEYIIAMYYTPTGLYQGFDDFFFDGQSGMILYHVDARLGPNSSVNYPTYFLNNNTDSSFKLIRYIEADGNNSLYNRNPEGWMWASDVFRPGSIFGSTNNVGYAWNQSSRGQVPFTIRVNSEALGMSELTISVRF